MLNQTHTSSNIHIYIDNGKTPSLLRQAIGVNKTILFGKLVAPVSEKKKKTDPETVIFFLLKILYTLLK